MQSLTTLIPSLPFLAILAPIALCWAQVKNFLTNTLRLFLVEAQVHNDASKAVLYFLREHGKRAPTNVAKYLTNWEYIKKTGRLKMVVFEGTRDLKSQWYWFEGNVIMISDKRGVDKETGIGTEAAITVRYLRGTVDIEDMICRAVKWYEDRDSLDTVRAVPRFIVTRFVGKRQDVREDSPSSFGTNSRAMSTPDEDWKYSRLINYAVDDIGYAKRDFFYIFNDNARLIKDDVTRWLDAKTWYQDKGLLFRRGSLLFGAPGSGKSSLIRKIGQSLDLPVFSFELATMDDTQFITFWAQSRQCQPCIVVMEDIDTVFNKRAPANANIRLSFECLLNCISGVEPAEGIYLFVTTNRLECLDDALGIPNEKGVSTRPGRLDTCFHMGDITLTEKREIVKHFLAEYPAVGEYLIETSNGCTAAQFSDMCAQKALELYWSKTP
jgi:ATPase family protein associated with various cellular activities (AAA)